jgi:superfamily I DNA/RNA helicase
MTQTPTEEQQSAIEHCAQASHPNLMLNALAGTGKSATLKMIDKASKIHPALYLVFNKRNADEAKASEGFRSTTTIKTFNACGHGIWAGYVSTKLVLDKAKSRTIWRRLVDDMTKTEATAAWREYHVVMEGLEKAKALGYVPRGCKLPHQSLIDQIGLHHAMDEIPNDIASELIDDILLESIKSAYGGLIDFNDQIYMPALFGGTYPKFPRVMVDEYQDQSPVNHAMLARLVKGHLIGVGDPFQNIYGFRGAKSGGMINAISTYSMSELPLSVSFRCPQAIVEAARWRVPHFKWTKVGGSVNEVTTYEGRDFADDATIICRNNAPLLRLAFHLISIGRSVNVVGSELGPRLVGILKKLGDSTMPREKALSAIEEWRETKLVAGSKSANDLADCMRVLCEHGDSLGQAISYAEHIFAQTGTIRLLTGHKSKGLEFDNVFWLDPWLCKDTEQDKNLSYVITTRSQNKLTMLDSSCIRW